MQVNLSGQLLLCQDSYLGNIYLGSEIYEPSQRGLRAGYGVPVGRCRFPGGKAPGSHVGHTAHHGTDLSSPGAEHCRRQRQPRTQIPRSGAAQTAGLTTTLPRYRRALERPCSFAPTGLAVRVHHGHTIRRTATTLPMIFAPRPGIGA